MLSKRPQVDYVDEEGFTALASALQIEADCGLPPDEAAALTCRLIDLLIDADADVNQTMHFGATVLHTAAIWSSPAAVTSSQ